LILWPVPKGDEKKGSAFTAKKSRIRNDSHLEVYRRMESLVRSRKKHERVDSSGGENTPRDEEKNAIICARGKESTWYCR